MNVDPLKAAKARKALTPQPSPVAKPPGSTVPPAGPPPQRPPLYRRIDWLTFGLVFLVTFIGYLLTLAPDLTLEDSGELAVGSFYAGVPHPPGYPVWTIYSWLFTVLLPIWNVAFRVAVSSAVSASLACGLLGLMVSRGSSMIIEGVTEFKGLSRAWENAICVLSGFVAGCLLGFNGFYWSQAVIVEVYCFSVLSLMVLLCFLLRWVYAPTQYRYLYLTAFMFGLCITNHQTLLVAAMGIEVAVLAVHRKLGRNLFLVNGLVYLLAMGLKYLGWVGAFDNNIPLFVIFNVIGIGSIYTVVWFVLKLDWFSKSKLILIHLGVNILIWAFWLFAKGQAQTSFSDASHTLLMVILNSVGIGLLYIYYLISGKAEPLLPLVDWVLLLSFAAAWYFSLGAASCLAVLVAYAYYWLYVRPGWWQARVETTPLAWGAGIAGLGLLAALFFGLSLPFYLAILGAFGYYWFLLKGKWPQAHTDWTPVILIVLAWAVGAAWYFYMPLTSMTNPPMNWGYPRTWEGFLHALTRGQYEKTNPIASAGRFEDAVRMYCEGAVSEFNLVYLLLGLVPFVCFTRLQKRERAWLIGLTAIFACLGLLLLILLNPSTDKQSRDLNKVFFTASYAIIAMSVGYGLTLIAGYLATQYQQCRLWFLYGCAGAASVAVYTLACTLRPPPPGENSWPMMLYRDAFGVGLVFACIALFLAARTKAPLWGLLALYGLMPVHPIISHWSENEQHGHLFGYWFGHDMFTPPDLGQPGHFYPEMTRDAILFGGTDPGRFCPTYMIFCESFIPPSKKPLDPKFDRRDVYIITQNALADNTYLNYIRAHYNRSTEHDAPFLQEMLRGRAEKDLNLYTNALARAVAPIDRFFIDLGQRIEDRRRREGVYPPTEIHTPSPEESKKCFEDYITDAQRRLALNQLEPGEDVRIVDNRVQVQGQVSVMQINGLLTKIIFDANPDHEFFVEESFPLKWMYPYLTPFGIIMKLNRHPVPEITPEMVNKDHEFWSLYSNRLTGNWITYDTPISNVCDFVERVYRRMDFKGFKGDPKFVRDNDAQKAFSKLRSAIAGIYAWRVNAAKPGSAEQQRMFKEAEFAFKQSFSFCPYSPEAVFRYVNLLASAQRLEEALLIAKTCLDFDPENKGVNDLVNSLTLMLRGQQPLAMPGQGRELALLEQQYRSNPGNMQAGFNLVAGFLQQQQTNLAWQVLDQMIGLMEPQFRSHPSNAQLAFSLAQAYGEHQEPTKMIGVIDSLIRTLEPQYQSSPTSAALAFHLAQAYLQRQRTVEALAILDKIISAPNVDQNALLSAAQLYASAGNPARLEACLARLTTLAPDSPEAWFDLAGIQAIQGKNAEAMKALTRCLTLSNQRLEKQPGAKDLAALAAADPRFKALQALPEFKKLTGKK